MKGKEYKGSKRETCFLRATGNTHGDVEVLARSCRLKRIYCNPEKGVASRKGTEI